MSMDPKVQADIEAFLKKTRRQQIDELVKVHTSRAPDEKRWLYDQVLIFRILIESSQRLEWLTGWLVGLTIVLAVLTGILAFGELAHLLGK